MNKTELMVGVLLRKGLTVEQVSEELSLDRNVIEGIATRDYVFRFSLIPPWLQEFEKEAGYAGRESKTASNR